MYYMLCMFYKWKYIIIIIKIGRWKKWTFYIIRNMISTSNDRNMIST